MILNDSEKIFDVSEGDFNLYQFQNFLLSNSDAQSLFGFENDEDLRNNFRVNYSYGRRPCGGGWQGTFVEWRPGDRAVVNVQEGVTIEVSRKLPSASHAAGSIGFPNHRRSTGQAYIVLQDPDTGKVISVNVSSFQGKRILYFLSDSYVSD